MYKLVAIDLDGTLLNSQEVISEENKIALKMVADIGIKVVICSGRVYSRASIIAGRLGLDGPLITCNGAVVKDMKTEQILYSEYLGNEDCFRIIDLCHEKNLYFHVYVGDTMFTERIAYASRNLWESNKNVPEEEQVDVKLVSNIKDMLGKIPTPATKFVIIDEDLDALFDARNILSEIDSIEITSSHFDNFEVMSKGVNKGKALKFIAENFDINREEIIAIGDNENDYSMIKFAGLGIAMGNAENSVKEIADYITLTNDQNGVAIALHKFILQRT